MAQRKDLTCEVCRFVAKHPAGLGRHRTSRHGAPSKRAGKAAAKGHSRMTIEPQRDDGPLLDALARVEAKLDRLLAAREAEPRRGWRRRG